MTQASRSWVRAGLPPGTYDALADGLPASRLWSFLLDIAEARATGRRPAELVEKVERAFLEHPYYSQGLRFQIAARSNEGMEIPLIDGGAFDWVAKLTANSKAVYVASGLGSQLVPLMFRRLINP